ncbi:MAG: DUF2853 family protein [Saprospiraceae bacterium]
MGKFDEVVEKAKAHLAEHFKGHEVDEATLHAVTKGLGPSIYNKDSATVACSQSSETDTVRKNFLMKKHGLTDEAAADKAITEVCEQYKGSRAKMRPVFYYVLVKKLGLEKNYAK